MKDIRIYGFGFTIYEEEPCDIRFMIYDLRSLVAVVLQIDVIIAQSSFASVRSGCILESANNSACLMSSNQYMVSSISSSQIFILLRKFLSDFAREAAR